MKIALLALAATAAFSGLAAADEVVLRNGSTFVGAVREEGDKVVVEMDYGTMTFKKIDVKDIRRGLDVVRLFEERAAKAGGSKELVDVALWGREKGLTRRADDLLRRVIQSDPDQPEARRALGYERVGGQWLNGDALLQARGLTKVDGQWVTREQAERRLDRLQDRDRLELDAKVAAQRHEQEMLKLALERERIELERKAEEQRAIEAERLRITMDWAMRTGKWGYNYNPNWNNNSYDPRPVAPPPAAPVVTPKPQPPSPLPPPTVLPITPPSGRTPPVRQPQPPPKNDKEEEDKEKDKRR